MNDIDKVQEIINIGKEVIVIGKNNKTYQGLPVDGEKTLKQLGMSQGIVHIIDTETKELLCWMGVTLFLSCLQEN